jgi:hypothetical protein
MKEKRSILIVFSLLFLALGCTPRAKEQMVQPPPHSHYFPFTEVIGDYYLRLIVDHVDGDMALVFEDFLERPAKLVKCRGIHGKVTLPDGSVKDVVFKSHTSLAEKYLGRYYTRRSTMPRQCGIFTTWGEWIKTAAAFTLEVTVPLEGERYQRTFEYKAPVGGKPYHRK